MTQLGFLGAPDRSTPNSSRRPTLNANEVYTHVVTDGAKQVHQGGVVCALDGGTFSIGLYDVTEGVEGTAELLFAHDEELPERPAGEGEGYEIDTQLFSVESYSLNGHVGRELAVVGVNHSTREWASGNYMTENAAMSRGSLDTFPADPWDGSPANAYSPRSAALFLEPETVPDGTSRRIVVQAEGDGAIDRSRTVFDAFPDLSPEDGMAIDYDETTAAGASVEVLANGAVVVGPGSPATDSFDVQIRDAAGTWHGPETIELVEDEE